MRGHGCHSPPMISLETEMGYTDTVSEAEAAEDVRL